MEERREAMGVFELAEVVSRPCLEEAGKVSSL